LEGSVFSLQESLLLLAGAVHADNYRTGAIQMDNVSVEALGFGAQLRCRKDFIQNFEGQSVSDFLKVSLVLQWPKKGSPATRTSATKPLGLPVCCWLLDTKGQLLVMTASYPTHRNSD